MAAGVASLRLQRMEFGEFPGPLRRPRFIFVRLAGNGVYDVAVLITGDRDLVGAVQAVQELGCQVVLATPKLESTAKELRQLADEIVVVDTDALRQMLPLR